MCIRDSSMRPARNFPVSSNNRYIGRLSHGLLAGQAIRSRRANAGNSRSQVAAISKVPMPPIITEPTDPKSAAVAPDSNSPSWLEAPIKIEFTADTRPRM